MATRSASVVTPQRFAQGLSYQQFLAQAKVNLDKFAYYYGTAKVTPDDAAFFKKAVQAGAKRVLALGEDWCPDVFRGLPQLVKIVEASGMELKVFPRDANLDIMNEFLNQGQFQSIPTFVFYTDKQEYIGHWIERPKIANDQRAQIDADTRKAMAGAQDADIRKAINSKVEPLYPDWQQAEVKELRELLSSKLHIK